MKSCTVPTAYGVDPLDPNRPGAITLLKAAIFHDAVDWVCHCLCTSSICVASYTPEMSALWCSTASASVPRIGPEVITGEHTRMRRRADAMDRDIACTSLRARPGQK